MADGDEAKGDLPKLRKREDFPLHSVRTPRRFLVEVGRGTSHVGHGTPHHPAAAAVRVRAKTRSPAAAPTSAVVVVVVAAAAAVLSGMI